MRRYIIEIRIDGKVRRYPINAKDEAEAIERLKLRLPPHQREDILIDSINIDPSTIHNEEPFGAFLH